MPRLMVAAIGDLDVLGDGDERVPAAFAQVDGLAGPDAVYHTTVEFTRRSLVGTICWLRTT